MATAISMYYMSQQIGIALGISFSSGLLKHQFKSSLQKVMTDIPGATEVSSTHHFSPARGQINIMKFSTDHKESFGQFVRGQSITR